MKRSELKALIKEVVQEIYNDPYRQLPSKNQQPNVVVLARIETNVFPIEVERLIELAVEKYHLDYRMIGDTKIGTETANIDYIKFFGPSGQVDSFVEEVAQENGIEFQDTNDTSDNINENQTQVETIKWKDGFEVGVDKMGEPVGYKALGSLNSGIKLPDTNDWRRFFVGRNGNAEKWLSPKLKVWYEVDSSG